jgi:hypothetical protein
VLFIHNLRLVPLEQQTTRFRKALAQKAFALDTVGNFSIYIEFLDVRLNCSQRLKLATTLKGLSLLRKPPVITL